MIETTFKINWEDGRDLILTPGTIVFPLYYKVKNEKIRIIANKTALIIKKEQIKQLTLTYKRSRRRYIYEIELWNQ